jgi:internalin A
MGFRLRSDEGFLIEEHPEGRTLVVTGDWSDRAAKVLRSGKADGLTLNYARGYRERSLDFLQEWPLRRLMVLARTIKDFEPIYRLAATLEHLSLTTAPTAILDCARLPNLHELWVENWQQLRDSLSAAPGLRRLGIYGYGETDLLALTDNTALQSIRLKQAPRLERLLGIEGMSDLADVLVAGAHKLHDLASLPSAATSLATLLINTCGGVTAIDDIAALRNLSTLSVANCGNIDSLHPIAGLTELTGLYLYESTSILDGDLEPLLGLRNLRDLRMKNRKHYKPAVIEVKGRLGLTE